MIHKKKIPKWGPGGLHRVPQGRGACSWAPRSLSEDLEKINFFLTSRGWGVLGPHHVSDPPCLVGGLNITMWVMVLKTGVTMTSIVNHVNGQMSENCPSAYGSMTGP